MNLDYIQNIRYKLQKRVRRLNSVDYNIFHNSLIQFWGFLKRYPIFIGIIDDLERINPNIEAKVEEMVSEHNGLYLDDEIEHAVASYFTLKKCVESNNPHIEVEIGEIYSSQNTTNENFNDHLETYRRVFLEPFYDYLDEELDDQSAILALLRRYKHKCEWFNRNSLFEIWEKNTQIGERTLALHLYEYLHDQGIDFSIEPSSVSGEVDLISAQKTDDPLIADAKIFNPEKGKGVSYISKGFNQIYTYTQDYNEPFGYLIIYNTSDKDLKFSLRNLTQSTPFVAHNNRTIFLITIDIFPHGKSASKRGTLKPVEITEEKLIESIDEEI